MQLPATTVIGTGGLGSALVRAFCDHGIPLKSVFNRTVEKAESVSAGTGVSTVSSFPSSIDELGRLVFLTVADQAIEDIARRLADSGRDFSDYIIVHCSGNLSAGVLHPLKEKDAATASLHPLQTFTEESTADRFEEIYFSLQGDNRAFGILKKIAQQLGGRTLEVTAQQKSDLHAAAVFASNYLTTLLDASVQTASRNGVPEGKAKQALMPLIQTTLNNAAEGSFEDILTGPIKRGDIETVETHLELLDSHPELVDLYIALGTRTVRLAEQSDGIDPETAKKLHNIFNNYG